MDSLCHLVVGATIGELVAGRALGRKALGWGLMLGSLPDADVLAMPWLDQVQQLQWHRGFMHSLLFAALMAPLFGGLIARIHRGAITFGRAAMLVVAAMLSHLLLDCCTVYGTQIFLPFSDLRVAWNLLFIIDPLFMLPFVLATLALTIAPRGRPWRQRCATTAMLLGVGYLAWSAGTKLRMDRTFERAFAEQKLDVRRYMTAPGPLNTVLWRVVAEGPSGYWIGYRSLLDGGRPVRLRYLAREGELTAPLRDSRGMRAVEWFSDHYWIARWKSEQVQVSDIRFGEANPAELNRDPAFLFSWQVVPGDHDLRRATEGRRPPLRPLIGALRRRILGETTPLWPI